MNKTSSCVGLASPSVIDDSTTVPRHIEGDHICNAVLGVNETPRSLKVGVDEWTTGRWEGIEAYFVPPLIEVPSGTIYIKNSGWIT